MQKCLREGAFTLCIKSVTIRDKLRLLFSVFITFNLMYLQHNFTIIFNDLLNHFKTYKKRIIDFTRVFFQDKGYKRKFFLRRGISNKKKI